MAKSMTSIGVHGAGGRMGRAILAAVVESDRLSLAGAVDSVNSPVIGRDVGVLFGSSSVGIQVQPDLASLRGSDAVIDFSLPVATGPLVEFCESERLPLVVGTTGLDATIHASLACLAQVAPVVVAPNFSQGVTLLFHLARQATELLGSEFDAEIVEMHHRNKVDAPSGTAARLAEVVASAKKLGEDDLVHGRFGAVGARKKAEIGVMTLRGGDVVGDHTLVLAGPGERLELTHRAHTREIFAHGALRAARWVAEQPPGQYDMTHVMGLVP